MRHPRLRELILLVFTGGILAIGWLQLPANLHVPLLGFAIVFGTMHLGVRLLAPRADPLLLPMAALLVVIGAMQLAAIDASRADVNPDVRPLAPLQTGWLAVAALAFLITLYIFRSGLGSAWRFRYTIALIGLGSLLLPLAPYIGHEVNSARLWIRVGPLSFQPGEIAKVLIVLFLAAYLSERRELLGLPTRRVGFLLLPDPRYLAPLLGIVGLSMLVFVRQNDLGGPLLFFLAFMGLLWIGSGKAYYPVVGIVLFVVAVWIALQAFPHVSGRIDGWLDPWADPQNTGFQIIQGQYAMAEGGLTGMGLTGADSQPHLIIYGWTDLILAATGHTLGLAGVLVVVMAFVVLLTRTFLIALRSRSDLHALAAAGFGVVVGIQAAIIAGGVTRVLPLTGVTLPFVSYGGSSLLTNFVLLGCLVAISGAETPESSPEEVAS